MKAPKTHIFQDILARAATHRILPGRIKFARWYFRRAAARVAVGDPKAFIKNDRDMRNFKRRQILPGYMYMFIYDPRYKDKLKYYDTFPLVIPWRTTINKKGEKGFIGINLHYLDPKNRAKLMDALYDIRSNDRYNDNTKLKLTYDVLRTVAKDKHFEPCIHKYLLSHCRTKFFKMPAEYWDVALFLPAERFEKASKEQVWADSLKKRKKRA